VLFIILAAIAIVCAIAMLITRNAVHSALFLVVVMAVLAIFFLGLAGPFIAMVQVTVYAGAIMVLFLFVVMMLGAERVGARGRLRWQTPLAIVLGVALLAIAGLLLFSAPGASATGTQPASATFDTKVESACAEDVAAIETSGQVIGTPCLVGDELFTDYLFPFEVVSILIIVAMVGAVVLTRGERSI
jgi:NADH-quinone oxidoreductase subunit J